MSRHQVLTETNKKLNIENEALNIEAKSKEDKIAGLVAENEKLERNLKMESSYQRIYCYIAIATQIAYWIPKLIK